MTVFRGPIGNGITLTSSDSNPILVSGLITHSGDSYAAVYANKYQFRVIDNFGTLGDSYTGDGVILRGGGTVRNGSTSDTGALIAGKYNSVYVNGVAGSVVNFGTLSPKLGFAVYFGAGGAVVNGPSGVTTALIKGNGDGIHIGGAAGTVSNFGTIDSVGAAGIRLANGGVVTNGAVGSISGWEYGVWFTGAARVTNLGSISGRSGVAPGVVVQSGKATVVNGSTAVATALITSQRDAVELWNGGSVTNFGTIDAPGGASAGVGVYLPAGGAVTNGASTSTAARISGNFFGVYAKTAAAAVTNFATISGGAAGVRLRSGGTVVNGGSNAHAARIAGYFGVYAYGASAATITNFGTIAGYYTSVQFARGNDRLNVGPKAVFSGAVDGGAGTDIVTFAAAGTQNIADFIGFETFRLSNAGANTLTFSDINFAEVTAAIHVIGGSAGNTINAAGVTGSNRLVFTGGGGADIVFAGSATTISGGGGKNRFVFSRIGSSTIADFGASAGNALVLRDSGFKLGVDEGRGTASLQHLAASVFVADASGSFTNTSQRFAYSRSNGDLFYDPDGSGAGSSRSIVAVLSDRATLTAGTAGNLFFTS